MVKQDCWDYTKCGKKKKCPAYPYFGRQCVRITGTLCDEKKHGTMMQKIRACTQCPYYLSEHYDRRYMELDEARAHKHNDKLDKKAKEKKSKKKKKCKKSKK